MQNLDIALADLELDLPTVEFTQAPEATALPVTGASSASHTGQSCSCCAICSCCST